jgi:nucleotide-binding universal stress UspA family protein
MKILIATDGSEFSRKAIDAACELAKGRTDVAFEVLAVYEPQIPAAAEPYALSADFYQRLDEMAKQNAEDEVDKAAELMENKLDGQKAEIIKKIELGRPAQTIIEEAENWGADMIVVGSHGRGYWGRLAVGSVSDAVLHHAPCSVLIVRH